MGECLNLRAEIARNKLEIKKMATELGLNEKTLRNKIDGITDFSLGEARKIHEMFFNGVNFNYLFTREESTV